MVELYVSLVTNAKAARMKGWVAKVDIEKGDIEFLRPIEEERAKNGMLVGGTYDFEEGNFYIIASDDSSHRNPVQMYQLVICENYELHEIANITFTRGKSFSGESDEVVQQLKEIYKRQTNGRKVISSLIKLAQWYAQKYNIKPIDKKQLILNEIQQIAEKYGVSIDEIRQILSGD